MADTKQLKKCSRCKCEILLETYFSKNRKGEYYGTCNKCRASKKNPERITLKECQEVARSRDGECLSTEYKNNGTKMKWQCAKGHQWETTLCHIKNGTWCPDCCVRSGRNQFNKISIKHCQEFAENKGGLCLSTEYINNKTQIKWECSEGHQWNSIFTKKSWCIKCAGTEKFTIRHCQEFAENKGGKCLSTEYVNAHICMKWECKKGHQWKATFAPITRKKGTWCPNCVGKNKSISDCQKFAENKGGKCLSTEYIGCKNKMKWQCAKGHQWDVGFAGITNAGTWCPQCSGNRSEQLCREIIEKYLLEPFPTKKPKILEGLELDGYNKELNIAFEYNGKQHYEYIPHFHRNGEDDFEKQKERDRKKYRICREKKINLIIIPYQYDYTTPDELDDFIYTELCKII